VKIEKNNHTNIDKKKGQQVIYFTKFSLIIFPTYFFSKNIINL